MLKPPTTENNQSRGGNRGGGKKDRPAPAVPFLKVEDLSFDPVTAKILGVQTQNTGFNDAIVKLAIGGRSFFLGLNANNPNYEILFKAFGENENSWIGEEITIGIQRNEFYEKNFVHVFEAPKGNTAPPEPSPRGRRSSR